MILDGKRVLVTGGTGSLGKTIVHRLLTGEMGHPASVTVFSRDEGKQHYMRLDYLQRRVATEETIYHNFQQLLRFYIGDVRDYASVLRVVRDADVVVHAAALKQVPTCEYFPFEAVLTNIVGTHNLVRAIVDGGTEVESVVGISTDKACKPINAMGMTKALMERVLVEANMSHTETRFVAVRYGNVIASRGSVVPLFLDQIANGGPVTITDERMTRFLLSLNRAVDVIFAALESARPGEIYVPRIPSVRIVDLAQVLINGHNIEISVTGIRPGEKLHEEMLSEEEITHTVERGDYYAILPMLPELIDGELRAPTLTKPYSSEDITMNTDELRQLLSENLTYMRETT